MYEYLSKLLTKRPPLQPEMFVYLYEHLLCVAFGSEAVSLPGTMPKQKQHLYCDACRQKHRGLFQQWPEEEWFYCEPARHRLRREGHPAYRLCRDKRHDKDCTGTGTAMVTATRAQRKTCLADLVLVSTLPPGAQTHGELSKVAARYPDIMFFVACFCPQAVDKGKDDPMVFSTPETAAHNECGPWYVAKFI